MIHFLESPVSSLLGKLKVTVCNMRLVMYVSYYHITSVNIDGCSEIHTTKILKGTVDPDFFRFFFR